MFDTPILFLIFNRPDTTARVFNEIRRLKPGNLFVAADGPRKGLVGEDADCHASRQIVLRNIDWPCNLKTFVRDENAGCKMAVSQAIKWFFEHVEQGIILEDDCLPDPAFFPYCASLLEKYKDDNRIISIGGTNLGYSFRSNESYSFSRFMNMWGWATWKRSAVLVDYDMNEWNKLWSKNFFLQKAIQTDILAIDVNWIKYWREHFDLTASGEINTWDYQWIFAQLYYNKTSIFPSYNLIKNIGFTDKATHTPYPDHPIAGLPLQSLEFPLKHPDSLKINKEYEGEFLKKIWFSYKKESLLKIIKTKLLYIPFVHRMNNVLKKRALQ